MYTRTWAFTVLQTPPHSPRATALCERLLGTLRRECLDFLIPLTKPITCNVSCTSGSGYYNAGRPHMSLGPGIPQPPVHLPVALHGHRHQLPPRMQVVAQPILGGLHHAYRLAEQAA